MENLIISIKYQRQFQNTEISANSTWEVPIPNDDINTHRFFNENIVINTSNSDLKCIPDHNTNKMFIIPAKSSFGWSFKDDNMKFSNLQIVELSGNVVTADSVQVIVVKKRYEVITNG